MIDWTDAFDNSSYVARASTLGETWASAALAFRLATAHAQLDLAYGPDKRQKLDLFSSSGKIHGLVVLVHGGYWHSMDKSYSSHMAKGFLEAGWAVAIPSYRLAPTVSILDICIDVAAAIEFASRKIPGPIRLIGHSAGGHLVTLLMCVDSPLSSSAAGRVKKIVSVSGIHDLRPLIYSDMNAVLKLSEAEAEKASPALRSPRNDVPITFWVGAAERPELMRQTRLIAEKWKLKGALVSDVYESGQDHFSVVEQLADTHSSLCNALLN